MKYVLMGCGGVVGLGVLAFILIIIARWDDVEATRAPDPSPTASAVAEIVPTATPAPDPDPTTPEPTATEPSGGRVGTWECPGDAVADGGCLVAATTNLVAGLCVDYDPRISRIAGPHEEVFNRGDSARARIDGQGAVLVGEGSTATIFRNPACPAT